MTHSTMLPPSSRRALVERADLYDEIVGKISAKLGTVRSSWVQTCGISGVAPRLTLQKNGVTGRSFPYIDVLILCGAVV